MSKPLAWAGLVLAVLALALLPAAAIAAQTGATPAGLAGADERHASEGLSLREAALSLPVAAALGAVLAFRPQRRGTPPRTSTVIQTQIILAVVGAIVMLVVGASLARAFGIVGAASLVRYRSKVEDPKDAGVMLCCLSIGLASGVGIYWVAAGSTLFVCALLWLLESLEPERRQDFLLKIKTAGVDQVRGPIEQLLQRHGVFHDLRASTQEELTFAVSLPVSKRTKRLTSAIRAVANGHEIDVEWSDKKAGKAAA